MNRCYPTFRATFGITDEYGRTYSDIVKAFLKSLPISTEDAHIGYITYAQQDYILQYDKPVALELSKTGLCSCIISFQHRTTGFYAIARKEF